MTPVVIAVTATGTATGYSTSVSYQPAGTAWLNVTGGSLPGNLSLVPGTTGLAAGTYAATVSLTPLSGGTPLSVAMTCTLSADTLAATPATVNWSYTIGSGSSPSQSIALQTNDVGVSWTATSPTYLSGPSNGWLIVAGGGASGTSPVLNLNASGLVAGFYSAIATFTVGTASVNVPVNLTVHASGITFIAPYVGTTGVPGKVIIRGFGFTGATQVQFGATNATSFSVVNDTQIDANYPGLAAGTYAVTVGAIPTQANLVVMNAPAFAYAAVSPVSHGIAGSIFNAVYDAERTAIDVAWGATDGTCYLDPYKFGGGTWTTVSVQVQVLPACTGLALRPDGKTVLSATTNTIYSLTPPNFGASAFSLLGLGIGSLLPQDVAMANDGGLIGIGSATGIGGYVVFRYDSLFPGVWALTDPSNFIAMNRPIASSADGSTILLGSPDGVIPMGSYHAVDGSFSGVPFTIAPIRMSSSTDGSRWALTTNSGIDVLNLTTNTLLGTVASSSIGAISPKGDFVYTYAPGAPGLVHKYSVAGASGGVIPEVGAGTSVPNSPGAVQRIFLTPDGGSLVMVGDQNLIVMPAP